MRVTINYTQNAILHPMGAELQIVILPALFAVIGRKNNSAIMENVKARLSVSFT